MTLIVGLLLLIATSSCFANATLKEEATKWLLPRNVVPLAYNLKLDTHIENFNESKPETFSFNGSVQIAIFVMEATKEIVLHTGTTLTILSATLIDKNNRESVLDFSTFDNETAKRTLKSADDIETETYTVSINYSGLHKDDKNGFYRSFYTNENKEKKWLVTTQFESTKARAAFPCFDEPEWKATYDITITVSKSLVDNLGYSVLSNMPLVENPAQPVKDGDRYSYSFQSSAKKMSTYLVAFIVSDFQGTSPALFHKTKEFRTWGRRTYIDSGDGALSQIAGPAALDVLRCLLKIDFAYPKMDQVSVPELSPSAMENWGLVTFKEPLPFYNKTKHPTHHKQSVVEVSTHELAHQWFGNLVTLHWWSDIWLNEGFATFFQYHATDKINVPGLLDASTWKMIPQMVVSEMQEAAFIEDGKITSRPLTNEVYSSKDIGFGGVPYSKGGCVIRMWMHMLGTDKFYRALNRYLLQNAENVGTPEKLLEKFDEVADSSLKPSVDFKNWHAQAGYPVVSASCKDGNCTLTQERFLFTGEDKTKPKWTIPISFTTSTNPDFTQTKFTKLFKQTEDSAEISYDATSEWIIFNIQQTGFYRVNYNENGWRALTKVLLENHTVIHEINRAQLLDDALNLARAEKQYLSYDAALNLTQYLIKERDFIPWESAMNGLSFLQEKLSGSPSAAAKFKAHLLKLIGPVYDSLRQQPDSHVQRLKQNSVVSWACRLGYEPCVNSAIQLFANTPLSSIDPDVRTATMCTALREGGEDEWNIVWFAYGDAADGFERRQLISVLACSKKENILQNFLELTLDSNSGIRQEDLTSVFIAVSSDHPSNVQIAFKFLQDRLDDISNAYRKEEGSLGQILTAIAEKLGSEEDLKAMETLYDRINSSSNPLVQNAKKSASKAVDAVKNNKAWLDKKQGDIIAWLDQNYP